ncbi:insulinase family protein [Streptomyces sp. NBC_00464]|uniref:insulinase family protein n=1 Tax=Streptomyces sp. NBC_00464 TaxID=2975751 RepID=UPI002E16E5D5
MSALLIRRNSPLAWIRVRLMPSGAAGPRLVAGRVLAELLPGLPVSGVPLYRRLALLGSVLNVEADGQGMVAHITAEPDRIVPTLEALSSALHVTLPAGSLAEARSEAEATWQWERNDSEALADLLADLALHTPPVQWSNLAGTLTAAMEGSTPDWSSPAAVGELSATYVGPHDADAEALLHELVTQQATPAHPFQESAPAASHAHTKLDVVSDGSTLIRLGWHAPRRDHDDFPALAIAARIVGGHHRAWLTQEFRTERGWAYSPWSLLRSGPTHGLWQVSLRVPHAHVKEAVDRTRTLIRTCAPTLAEHHAATAHARTEILQLCSAGDTQVSLLGYWQELGIDPRQEKERWLTALAATTPEDVARAVGRWLDAAPHIALSLG